MRMSSNHPGYGRNNKSVLSTNKETYSQLLKDNSNKFTFLHFHPSPYLFRCSIVVSFHLGLDDFRDKRLLKARGSSRNHFERSEQSRALMRVSSRSNDVLEMMHLPVHVELNVFSVDLPSWDTVKALVACG